MNWKCALPGWKAWQAYRGDEPQRTLHSVKFSPHDISKQQYKIILLDCDSQNLRPSTKTLILFSISCLRKSWRPGMRCQSWSKTKKIGRGGRTSGCPWLCSRVFSRISSLVVVECHLVFQGIFRTPLILRRVKQNTCQWGTSAYFLICPRAKDSTRGRLSFHWPTVSPFPWNDQFWAFLSKENVSFSNKCCIYLCLCDFTLSEN